MTSKGMKYINPSLIEKLEKIDPSITKAIETLMNAFNFYFDVFRTYGLKSKPDQLTLLKLKEYETKVARVL